ncbi:hypothetical protein CK203_027620 [Vitis vinifera]|uniref:Uncharacterized protein n=1 Tax=Vitis vinifera TaxID=29760 RepID=A0A438DRR4_VITVI|nr:hypothetical protein CK203_091256 [Vitis vinifera]RVW96051.1 hypothetical protein CK203_027620 [Vitis vinifera]
MRIASSKNATAADVCEGEGSGGHWRVHFRRTFQDWELEEVTQFLAPIYPVRMQEREDALL